MSGTSEVEAGAFEETMSLLGGPMATELQNLAAALPGTRLTGAQATSGLARIGTAIQALNRLSHAVAESAGQPPAQRRPRNNPPRGRPDGTEEEKNA